MRWAPKKQENDADKLGGLPKGTQNPLGKGSGRTVSLERWRGNFTCRQLPKEGVGRLGPGLEGTQR